MTDANFPVQRWNNSGGHRYTSCSGYPATRYADMSVTEFRTETSKVAKWLCEGRLEQEIPT